MPNNAYTTHYIEGSEEDIKCLYELIVRVDNHPNRKCREKGYYGHMWWGHLLEELLGKVPEVDCRGHICAYQLDDDDRLYLDTESAWHAPYAIYDILRQHFPSIKIYYYCECMDDGTMTTNDVDCEYFTTRCVVDREDYEPESFDSLVDLCQWLASELEILVNTEDEAEDAIQKYSEDNDIPASLHICQVLPDE